MNASALRTTRDHFHTALRSALAHSYLGIVVTFFVLVGAVFLLTPPTWYPHWIASQVTGVGAFLYAFMIVLPAVVFTTNPTEDAQTTALQEAARTNLQICLSIIFLLALAGSCGLFELYQFGIPYDKLLHFFNTMLATMASSSFLFRWYKLSLPRAILIAALVVSLVNIGWEVVEYTSDTALGTDAFGIDGKQWLADTLGDLASDAVGAIAGVVAIKFSKNSKL